MLSKISQEEFLNCSKEVLVVVLTQQDFPPQQVLKLLTSCGSMQTAEQQFVCVPENSFNHDYNNYYSKIFYEPRS